MSLCLLLPGFAAHAHSGRTALTGTSNGSVDWTARIQGRDVGDIDGGAPLVLDPNRPLRVEMTITNQDENPVDIRSLRLEGRVVGLVFFRYTIALALPLEPGQKAERTVELELDDLAGQAVGLLPTDFELLGQDRRVLKQKSFPVEVRGSLWSAYGVFGVAVGAITAALLASLLIALARSALPRNRWTRGVQFGTVGVGVGLTLTFTLSATGLLIPNATAWLPIVFASTVGAFLVGYFLPLSALAADDEATADPSPVGHQ